MAERLREAVLVGLPYGQTQGSVFDPETRTRFEPGVAQVVTQETVERLRSVAQYGFTFWIGDPAALDVVDPPTQEVQ